jgi:hypothetical protein
MFFVLFEVTNNNWLCDRYCYFLVQGRPPSLHNQHVRITAIRSVLLRFLVLREVIIHYLWINEEELHPLHHSKEQQDDHAPRCG